MKTLLIVDVQNDFMPGGSLAVPDGDAIIPVINHIVPYFDLVAATQDWHPENHNSFASNHKDKNAFGTIDIDGTEQGLWPDHCVQGTKGAAFHDGLNINSVEAIFRKGMDANIDSYSAFYDNGHRISTGLAGYLREKGAEELWFCGLAADICVYYTIQDALKEKFKVNLIVDATRPLDDLLFNKQLEELQTAGVSLVLSDHL